MYMCVDVYDCGRVDGSVFTLLCSWEKFSQNLVERWRMSHEKNYLFLVGNPDHVMLGLRIG